MPKLGLTMEEGLIAEWLVQPGMTFSAGDPLVVIETDKIANEVQAQAAGILREIVAPAGTTVAVGVTIAYIGLASDETALPSIETVRPVPGATPALASEPAIQSARPDPDPASRRTEASAAEPPVAQDLPHVQEGEHRVVASPYARSIARVEALDLRTVPARAGSGMIHAADVSRALAKRPLSGQGATAPLVLLIERAVDLEPLMRLLQELPSRPGFDYRLGTAVILGLLKALWNCRPEDRLTDSVVVSTGLASAERHISLSGGPWTLSSLASLLHEDAQHEPDAAGRPTVRVQDFTQSSGLSGAALSKPGDTLAIGIGAVRQHFVPNLANQPELRRSLSLTLLVWGGSALWVESLLAEIAEFIENPLLLLV